jgi:hypothetical protein
MDLVMAYLLAWNSRAVAVLASWRTFMSDTERHREPSISAVEAVCRDRYSVFAVLFRIRGNSVLAGTAQGV